jgi:hypothetical protein
MKRAGKTKRGRGQSDKPNKDSRFIDPFAELRAWQRRLRIHPTAFNDPQRSRELAERLGSDRFSIFKSLVAAYQKKPNLENYVRLRREVPEAEIDIALFGGLDPLYALEPKLIKHDIDPELVAGALDGSMLNMDELSLRLMECLVAKKKLPKSGPKNIEMRRNAISDALVDYLIVMMLEATEWNKESALNEIPSSLIVLIRERLRGAWPDLRKEYLSSNERKRGAYLAAHHFKDFTEISVRSLEALTGTSRMTASRWLKDPSFKESFEWMKKALAEKESQKPK